MKKYLSLFPVEPTALKSHY